MDSSARNSAGNCKFLNDAMKLFQGLRALATFGVDFLQLVKFGS